MHPLSSAAASGFGISLAAAMGGRPRTPKRNVGAFPALDSVAHFDAINDRYWVQGLGYVPLSRLYRRNSLAWAFDENGVLRQYGVNEPRRVPAPDGVMAALREPASTNPIRNNTMAGAGVGTLPTNWSGDAALLSGITRDIVGTGVEFGMEYLDVRWSGTSTAGIAHQLFPEASGIIGTAVGTTWYHTLFSRVVNGSFGGGSIYQRTIQRGGGAYLTEGAINFVPTAALTRTGFAYVASNAAVTHVQPGFYLSLNSGLTIDVTLRVYLPQIEAQVFPTSPIKTSTGAVTRDRDGIFIPMDTPLGAVGAQSQYMDCLVPYTRNDWNRLTSGSSVALALSATGGTPAFAEVWNGSVAPSTSNLVAFGSRAKVSYAGDGASRSICLNGGPVKTDPSAVVSPQASWVGLGTGVLLGQLSDGSDAQAPICYVHEFIAANRKWADDRLVGMTR